MIEIKALINAYGNCVLTWSIWLEPAAIEEIIVVSEIGEQWSPKIPPPKTDDKKITWESGKFCEIVIDIGTIIANVPHDEPVENAIKHDVKNRLIMIIFSFKKGGINVEIYILDHLSR